MSKPVQEPSVQRQLGNQEWGILQLQRRPAPSHPLILGEAYTTSQQSIPSGAYTQITGFDEWTITNAAFIDQDTDGLTIETTGYYLLSGFVVWAISVTNTTVNIEIGSAATGWPVDLIASPQAAATTFNRTIDLQYIVAPTTLELWVQHFAGVNRNVIGGIKVVHLGSLTTPPYWA